VNAEILQRKGDELEKSRGKMNPAGVKREFEEKPEERIGLLG
jgi:hypothetical protein